MFPKPSLKRYFSFITLIMLSLVCLSSFALESDYSQAITIEADSAVLDENKGQTIYKGNVEVKQGSLLLKADILTVSQDAKTKQANQLSAHGKPAYFEQQPKPDEEKVQAQADSILYFITSEKIELVGNAELKQGSSQIVSDKISYFAKERIFKAKQQENSTGEKKRVQVTIPAPKNDNNSSEKENIEP